MISTETRWYTEWDHGQETVRFMDPGTDGIWQRLPLTRSTLRGPRRLLSLLTTPLRTIELCRVSHPTARNTQLAGGASGTLEVLAPVHTSHPPTAHSQLGELIRMRLITSEMPVAVLEYHTGPVHPTSVTRVVVHLDNRRHGAS